MYFLNQIDTYNRIWIIKLLYINMLAYFHIYKIATVCSRGAAWTVYTIQEGSIRHWTTSDQIRSQIRSQIRCQIRSQIRCQIRSQIICQVQNFVKKPDVFIQDTVQFSPKYSLWLKNTGSWEKVQDFNHYMQILVFFNQFSAGIKYFCIKLALTRRDKDTFIKSWCGALFCFIMS